MPNLSSDNYLIYRLRNIFNNYQKILIIGLGNPIRGDDGLGVHITETLNSDNKLCYPEILTCYNSPANYLGKIIEYKPDFIIFVDSIYHENFENGDVVIVNPNQILEVESNSTHYQSYQTILQFVNSELRTVIDHIVVGINITQIKLEYELSNTIKESVDVVISSIESVIKNA
jgi:hydrogenase 3 maturation protease